MVVVPNHLWIPSFRSTSIAAPIICRVSSWSVISELARRSAEYAVNAKESSDNRFFVSSKGGAEGVADFAEGGVSFDRAVDVGHKILRVNGGRRGGRRISGSGPKVAGLGSSLQCQQRAVHFGLGAVGAQFLEAGGLAVSYRFVD